MSTNDSNTRPQPHDETRLIWVDVETTGLDPQKDELLELACIITDSQLDELDRWEGVFWRPPGLWGRCDPFIQKMHGGPEGKFDQYKYAHSLIGRIESEGEDVVTYEKAQKELVGLFWSLGVAPGKGIFAGSSPHFDRVFVKQNLPQLETFLGHRHFDVSTLTMAVRYWDNKTWPGNATEDTSAPKHRAMPDIEETLRRARLFRTTYTP